MGKRKRGRDPFADYIEWTNNRYNPGYYLGGNLEPHLRKNSLGPNGRRLAGVLLGVSAVLSFGSILSLAADADPGSRFYVALSVPFVLLAAAAARAMYRVGKTASPRRERTQRSK